jgi:hypothetical protein
LILMQISLPRVYSISASRSYRSESSDDKVYQDQETLYTPG